MTERFDCISFLSDYGLDDEFVGVVKSVIRSVAPRVDVVDITHGIAPHDVRAGSLALARSVQYLNPGVVLAVVDPGVGVDNDLVFHGWFLCIRALQCHAKAAVTREPVCEVRPVQDWVFIFASDRRQGRDFPAVA